MLHRQPSSPIGRKDFRKNRKILERYVNSQNAETGNSLTDGYLNFLEEIHRQEHGKVIFPHMENCLSAIELFNERAVLGARIDDLVKKIREAPDAIEVIEKLEAEWDEIKGRLEEIEPQLKDLEAKIVVDFGQLMEITSQYLDEQDRVLHTAQR